MEDYKDPSIFISKWQEIIDLLAKLIGIPSALIMRCRDEQLEVFVASNSANNPLRKGDKEKWHGLFCETVIKTQEKLLVKNALNDKRWTIKQDMIAYLGFPLNFPNGTPFGSICILDNKENPFSNDYETLLSLFKNAIELDLAILQLNKSDEETLSHDPIKMVIKQQQEHLKTKKEADLNYTFFKKLFDSMADSVFLIDLGTGTIILANETASEAYGYTSEELNGMNVSVLDPNFQNSEQEILRKVLIETGSAIFDTTHKTKDGRLIPVEIRTQQVDKSRFITVARDITARIENENRLKELNATKDKLFSIISHDLRSPFNALLGLSDLLVTNIEEYSQDEIRQFSGMLNDSASQAYRLLENLLSWSKMQTGTFKMNPAPLNPSDLIYEITELMTPVAKAKDIGLLSRIEPCNNVFADPDMIKTVLRNLISNAIKFTHPGGTVTIETKPDKHNVLMIVADTGIGIDKEHIPTIFSVDNKLSRVGTAKETGSGLGLMLCKEFVEKIGGNIWIESRLGEGSSFMFTVPVAT